MTARSILAVALAACSGGSTMATPDAQPIDAAPIDAQVCFGIFGYCFTSPPAGELVLRDTLDTTSDARCDPAIAAVCAIGAHDIVVSQLLKVSGTRPLALIGRTVQVDGEIALVKTAGIAADCMAPAAPATTSGGGAGGSFGTRGGNGGTGAGAGGTASAPIAPTALRGGCPGGADDAGTGLTVGGLALIGTQSITLFAGSWINACGTGGLGSTSVDTGGGGGGSGGMVVLDAPAIQLDGNVLAIGGGGGGGSSSVAVGTYGSTGCGQLAITTAIGGSGPGAKGGDGATSGPGMPGASSSSNGDGGGGGGGGAGLVLVHGMTTGSGTILPPKTAI